MIDPMLSLALALHSNKGAYALLLGSGVSRAAGIPTGWEIVLDLVRKLACLQSSDCGDDPAAWYKASYGKDPDYSELLDAIAKSPSERNQLLRAYFEPTEEEREQGLKIPTKAHRAIARLAATGHVRVIVTTNFDRLIETALADAGVTPTVISTPDAVEGALPLIHTSCAVVKLHGDYLDTRIKNTPKELERYDRRVNRLLDRILDEFGLIVSGWSGEWDTALRAAMERCRQHRFTTFWATRSEPGAAAKSLIELRLAQLIRGRDADSFFQDLTEKVEALDEFDQPHPLSAKVAVASLKLYLTDDRHRIRVNDLVMQEAERLCGEFTDENFSVQARFTDEQFPKLLADRVRRYETLTQTMQALFATGCFWGEQSHEAVWVRALERLANADTSRNGTVVWLNLRRYPALLLLYVGGLTSIAAERYSTFAALLTRAKFRGERKEQAMVVAILGGNCLKHEHAQCLPGMERRYTPISDHLHEVLRDPLRDFLPDDAQYDRCFDRFEYLLGLVHLTEAEYGWGPLGRFGWRIRHEPESSIITQIDAEVAQAGEDWPPLRAGLFGGSIESFRTLKEAYDKRVWERGWD